jgi:hypothetical protein
LVAVLSAAYTGPRLTEAYHVTYMATTATAC